MPQMLDVTLYHGLRTDAGAAHRFITAPCSQYETRTLYHLHDLGGTHLTIVTDDMHYDPTVWGKQVCALRQREYQPHPLRGSTRQFLIRLNRERRGLSVALKSDEQLDGLLERMMGRAGAEVIDYTVRTDFGYSLDAPHPNIPTATFEGVLRVNDTALMYQALLQGLGRAKRYGCGLLLTRALDTWE